MPANSSEFEFSTELLFFLTFSHWKDRWGRDGYLNGHSP